MFFTWYNRGKFHLNVEHFYHTSQKIFFAKHVMCLIMAGAVHEFGVRFPVSVVRKNKNVHKNVQMSILHPLVKFNIVGSLRDREVACSASDLQGFKSCVWRAVSSHHPQEVLLAQFSRYVHKSGLKPDSFHFIVCVLSWQIICLIFGLENTIVGFARGSNHNPLSANHENSRV